MGRAAGAAVDPRDLHNPHVLRQLQLAAVFQLLQRLPLREGAQHRQIVPHHFVGQGLHLHQLLPGKLPVKVDGHAVLPHVEAHVLAAVELMGQARDDVLAGVVLHSYKPLLPVYPAGQMGSHRQRLAAGMEDLPSPLLHIRHRRRADEAGVRLLAAALREKGGPVQNHCPALLVLAAVQHRGLKVKQVAVDIIEFLGCH